MFIRKILRLIILVLILCFGPIICFADSSGTCGSDANWSLSGASLTISGTGRMTDFTDDNPAPWSDGASAIKNVIVGEGITDIGSLAFYNCGNLRSISLPSTLTRIGDRSFKGCKNLIGVSLPSKVDTIAEAAFESCESLMAISLPQGMKSIGNYTFYRCYSLSTVDIPSSVTSLGRVAFAYCSSLSSVNIRASIASLPAWTFYECGNLTTLSLPSSMTAFGDDAFTGCTGCVNVYYSGSYAAALSTAIGEVSDSFTGVKPNPTGDSPKTQAPSFSRADDGNYYSDNGELIIVPEGEAPAAEPRKEVSQTHTSTVIDENTSRDEEITITTTDDAVIKKTDSFVIHFEPDDTNPTGDTDEPTGTDENTGTISVSDSSSKIEAIIDGSGGWSDVADIIRESSGGSSKPTVEVVVSNGAGITGEALKEIANSGVKVSIQTDNGSNWDINGSDLKDYQNYNDEYNLNYVIEKNEDPGSRQKKVIGDAESYVIRFENDIDFNATVKIRTDARKGDIATLYLAENGLTKLSTVLVDGGGMAAFSISSVSKNTDYIVALNVEGEKAADAIIPEALYSDYGIDDYEEGYLMDAQGNKYVVGERTSSWGITGGQFAIYVGIGLGVLVLIVTLVMIAINKNSKSKAKYAAMKERDEAKARRIARHAVEKAEESGEAPDTRYEELGIDEDELRLKVMREMLEEAGKSKNNNGE